MLEPVVLKPTPKRVLGEGEVACPRKGPLHDRIAWEKCTRLRELSPNACGGCLQHIESSKKVQSARDESGRVRWSRT